MIVLFFLSILLISTLVLLYNLKHNIRSKFNMFFVVMSFIGSYGAIFSFIFKYVIIMTI